MVDVDHHRYNLEASMAVTEISSCYRRSKTLWCCFLISLVVANVIGSDVDHRLDQNSNGTSSSTASSLNSVVDDGQFVHDSNRSADGELVINSTLISNTTESSISVDRAQSTTVHPWIMGLLKGEIVHDELRSTVDSLDHWNSTENLPGTRLNGSSNLSSSIVNSISNSTFTNSSIVSIVSLKARDPESNPNSNSTTDKVVELATKNPLFSVEIHDANEDADLRSQPTSNRFEMSTDQKNSSQESNQNRGASHSVMFFQGTTTNLGPAGTPDRPVQNQESNNSIVNSTTEKTVVVVGPVKPIDSGTSKNLSTNSTNEPRSHHDEQSNARSNVNREPLVHLNPSLVLKEVALKSGGDSQQNLPSIQQNQPIFRENPQQIAQTREQNSNVGQQNTQVREQNHQPNQPIFRQNPQGSQQNPQTREQNPQQNQSNQPQNRQTNQSKDPAHNPNPNPKQSEQSEQQQQQQNQSSSFNTRAVPYIHLPLHAGPVRVNQQNRLDQKDSYGDQVFDSSRSVPTNQEHSRSAEHIESNSNKNPRKHFARNSNSSSSSSSSGRQFQMIEIQPGVHLHELHPDSPVKLLRIPRQMGNTTEMIELTLNRLDDDQWRIPFFQMSHYLITHTDRLGFFKVSMEEIFQRPVHGHPNMNYHQLIRDHTNLYVCDRNSSVLLITRFGSYLEIYGLISDQMMITPIWRHSQTVLPEGAHLPPGFNRREHLDQFYTNRGSRSLLHVLIDNGESVAKHMGFDIGKLMEQINAQFQKGQIRRGLGYPEPGPVIYPEVSMLIDYWAYQNHGRNVDELWRYMVIYFTRIDLIYRQLSEPRIQMRLTNIYIATQPFLFQLVQPRLRFKPVETNSTTPKSYLNALKAINELGVYFHLEPETFAPHSDLMLVITGQDLCLDSADSAWLSKVSAFDSCSYATTRGQSFVGGACHADSSTPRAKNLNVAIVEDSGYFDGVLVAAHELGHLMGSVHDGEWPITGILGPGGKGCHSQGYLMSNNGVRARTRSFSPSYNQFRWSQCSEEQFRYFTHLPQSTCLYHRP